MGVAKTGHRDNRAAQRASLPVAAGTQLKWEKVVPSVAVVATPRGLFARRTATGRTAGEGVGAGEGTATAVTE